MIVNIPQKILLCPIGEFIVEWLMEFIWFLLHRKAILLCSFFSLLPAGSYFQKLLLSSLFLV